MNTDDKIKVSIIVPVYNVERYLGKCLDSLVNQTLKDIEIICVNDGSTDRSTAILKDYADKDKRIFSLIRIMQDSRQLGIKVLMLLRVSL